MAAAQMLAPVLCLLRPSDFEQLLCPAAHCQRQLVALPCGTGHHIGFGCSPAAQSYTGCFLESAARHLPMRNPPDTAVLSITVWKAFSAQGMARTTRLLATVVGIGILFGPLSAMASPEH